MSTDIFEVVIIMVIMWWMVGGLLGPDTSGLLLTRVTRVWSEDEESSKDG